MRIRIRLEIRIRLLKKNEYKNKKIKIIRIKEECISYICGKKTKYDYVLYLIALFYKRVHITGVEQLGIVSLTYLLCSALYTLRRIRNNYTITRARRQMTVRV